MPSELGPVERRSSAVTPDKEVDKTGKGKQAGRTARPISGSTSSRPGFFSKLFSKSPKPEAKKIQFKATAEISKKETTTNVQRIGNKTLFKSFSDKISSWLNPPSHNEPAFILDKLNAKIDDKMKGGLLTKKMDNKEEAARSALKSLNKTQLDTMKKYENLSKLVVSPNLQLFKAIKSKLTPTELAEFSSKLVDDTLQSIQDKFNIPEENTKPTLTVPKEGSEEDPEASRAAKIVGELSNVQMKAFSKDPDSTDKLVRLNEEQPKLFSALDKRFRAGQQLEVYLEVHTAIHEPVTHSAKKILNKLVDSNAPQLLKNKYLPFSDTEQERWSKLSDLVSEFTHEDFSISHETGSNKTDPKLLLENFATPVLYNLKRDDEDAYNQLIENIKTVDGLGHMNFTIKMNIFDFEVAFKNYLKPPKK